MTLEAIARNAAALGLQTAGISDHIWLDPERGCRPTVAHILGLREEIARLPSPPRFLLGAESDCAPPWGPAGGAELARLDFVIGSYHFADVRLGAMPAPATAAELAVLLLAGFRSVVDGGHVTVAGHPFHIPRRIYAGLPPALAKNLAPAYAFVRAGAHPLLALAASLGVALELNAGALFPRLRPELLPVFREARELGCRFILSSDAHRPEEMERRAGLLDYAASIGRDASSMLDFSGPS